MGSENPSACFLQNPTKIGLFSERDLTMYRSGLQIAATPCNFYSLYVMLTLSYTLFSYAERARTEYKISLLQILWKELSLHNVYTYMYVTISRLALQSLSRTHARSHSTQFFTQRVGKCRGVSEKRQLWHACLYVCLCVFLCVEVNIPTYIYYIMRSVPEQTAEPPRPHINIHICMYNKYI